MAKIIPSGTRTTLKRRIEFDAKTSITFAWNYAGKVSVNGENVPVPIIREALALAYDRVMIMVESGLSMEDAVRDFCVNAARATEPANLITAIHGN